VLNNLNDGKPLLSYPCQWQYTVIGADWEAIRLAVADVVGGADYSLAESHTSRKGRYCSGHLALVVQTEEHRTTVFHALSQHPAIKAVM
jgi:uncharacterized protein